MNFRINFEETKVPFWLTSLNNDKKPQSIAKLSNSPSSNIRNNSEYHVHFQVGA